MSLSEIKSKCEKNNLTLVQGRFEFGVKYKIKAVVGGDDVVWPCKNLVQCDAAIVQALWLKKQQEAVA